MGREQLNKKMDTLFPQENPDLCRVCKEPVVDGRWNYCSDRCREIAQAVQKMYLWDSVKEQVLERDDYTCVECGLSKRMWWRAYHTVQHRIKEQTQHLYDADKYDKWRAEKERLEERYGISSPVGEFHVDHIERIADGGHPFDESNLRTLCSECHKEKTRKENTGRKRDRQEITLEDYIDD